MNSDIWLPTAPARMPLTKPPVNTESALRMHANQTYISECLLEIRQGPIRDCGRLTGYAEVIPVHSTAPLLPACRQSAQNPVFHFPQPRFVAHEGPLSRIPALRPSATRSVTPMRF